MTTLTALDISPDVAPLSGFRSIEETVKTHCEGLGLCPQQIDICLEVARTDYSAESGTRAANRIAEKMREIRRMSSLLAAK